MKRIPIIFLFAAALASADTVFTLDTTPLQSSGAGPFTLDFQFIDGNGTGDGNNTVTLTDFDFGGGSVALAAGYPIGGVTVGSGPFSITMTDSSFFNEVQFLLTPGTQISFSFATTLNQDAAAPDAFTLAILDGTASEIATTNPNFNDSFIELDLPTSSSDLSTILSGSADGASVDLSAPTQGSEGSPGSVPEPGSAVLLLTGLAAIVRRGRARLTTGS